MALPFDRQRQLELEAEAEFELEQEQQAQKRPEGLGANYDKSLGANAWKGIADMPKATIQSLVDTYGFASDPFGTIENAGAEKSLRTVGSLAAGTAGAAALAPVGAGWGSFFGPLGTAAGGVLGGAAGFGLGLGGFDFANDVASEGLTAVTGNDFGGIKSVGDYAKDLVYNTTQGATGGFAVKGLSQIPKVKKLAAPFTDDGAGMRVATELERLEPGYAQKIDTALTEQAGDRFLDTRPLGELIDSDNIKSIQRTLPRGDDVTAYGRAAELNRVRNDNILRYLDDVEQSPLTVDDVQASILDSVEQKKTLAQRGVDFAEADVRGTLDDLPPPIEPSEAGGQIRGGVLGREEALTKLTTEEFNKTGNGEVIPGTARSIIETEMPKYFKEVGRQPDDGLIKLIEGLNKQGETSSLVDPISKENFTTPARYTMQDIQALRSQALEVAQSGNRKSKAIANQIAEALKKDVDEAVKAGTVTPEQVGAWEKGIALRKTKGAIYENSALPTKSVLSKQPYGEFKLPDSAVPPKYFRGGKKGTREGVQNYKKAFGATEEALEPLYRYASTEFQKYAAPNGIVDAGKARKWLDLHEEALKDLPDLKRQLSDVETRQTFLNEKLGELKMTQAEIEKGAARTWLQADPKAAVKAMLSGKDMIKRTIATKEYLQKHDSDALAGLRRAVTDYIKEESFIPSEIGGIQEALSSGAQFKGKVLGGTLTATIDRIKPALIKSKLFNEPQLKMLDEIYKEKKSQLSVEEAKMAGGSDTIQNNNVFSAINRMAGNFFLNRIPGNRFLQMIAPVIKTIPEVKYKLKLEEAVLNPRLARDLWQKATAKNVTRTIETIFKEDLDKAFGRDNSALTNSKNAAKIGAPFIPVATSNNTERPKPKPIPKQEAVTSKKSFPTSKEILNPPAKGELRKSSLDLSRLSAETQARIAVESSGNPDAVSPKGAEGLNQIMPTTGQEIAMELGETYMPIRPGMSPEERELSIDQNNRFGDYYYNKQLKKFKNPTLARAAYNAGPRRVEEAMKLAGTSTDVNKILANLPKGVQAETVPYVNKIMARLNQG
jgi:Transglycosylase SLT domain